MDHPQWLAMAQSKLSQHNNSMETLTMKANIMTKGQSNALELLETLVD